MKYMYFLTALVVPCLGASLEGRIVGGEPANPGDVPSIVSLRGCDGNHFCGGILISKDWVLTAAHCIGAIFSAQFGNVNITTSPEDGSVIFISKTIAHEDYNRTEIENDIALVKLDRPVTFGKYVKAAILPKQDELVPKGGNAMVAGWGVDSSEYMVKNLNKVNLTIVDLETCRKGNAGFAVFDTNVCAGDPEGVKSECVGDSGGPLILDEKVVGIISWSLTCGGSKDKPGVFTRVASYIKWIEENTNIKFEKLNFNKGSL